MIKQFHEEEHNMIKQFHYFTGKTYKLGKSWTEAKLKARLKARLERYHKPYMLYKI